MRCGDRRERKRKVCHHCVSYYKPSFGPRWSNVRDGDKDGGGEMDGPQEEAGRKNKGNPRCLPRRRRNSSSR